MITGEDPIVDKIPNVSVIFVTLTGLDEKNDSPEFAINQLKQINC